MASTYDQGDLVRETGTFKTASSAAADPTKVYLDVQKPSGGLVYSTYAAGTTAITRTGTGVYYKDILTTASGLYEYRWHSTGTVHTAEEGWFNVRTKRVQ
jgi:hypothetical protein